MSVREGIDYLMAVANSLLRQGFKRQIYISFHGPAHMTCSPMVRDFFDETGVPILYMDLTMQMMKMQGIFYINGQFPRNYSGSLSENEPIK